MCAWSGVAVTSLGFGYRPHDMRRAYGIVLAVERSRKEHMASYIMHDGRFGIGFWIWIPPGVAEGGGHLVLEDLEDCASRTNIWGAGFGAYCGHGFMMGC